MKVVIRADGSTEVGGGHVGRCLALAEALKKKGAAISFLCSVDARLGMEMIKRAGFSAYTDEGVAANADWLVVDHYGLDARWQNKIKGAARVLVIDDLADRPHACDLLLDPGRAADEMNVYDGLVPKEATRLAGPRYALLRNEFQSPRLAHASGQTLRVMVFFGSVDRAGLTERALDALKDFAGRVDIHAVVTSANPRRAKIALRDDVTVHEDVDDMAALLATMDLAIGAGGVALWERCCLGLPGLAVALNDNQRPAVTLADAAGAVKMVAPENFAQALAPLLDGAEIRRAMSQAARTLVDGRGADRVTALMGGLTVRPATPKDAERLWSWANDAQVREMAFNPALIPWEGHVEWLTKKLTDPASLILLAEQADTPVGQVRFDYEPEEHGVVIDISLSPGFRGQGLGVEVLLKSVLIYLNSHPETRVAAWVKTENAPSLKLFRATGFHQDGERDGAVRLSFPNGQGPQ